MQRVLLMLCVAAVTERSMGAYEDYPDPYQKPLSGRYQGPAVVPVILPGGFIADTEEVAKAKNLHFNAFAHHASNVKDSRYNPTDDDQSYDQPKYTQAAPGASQVYTTPQYTQSIPQATYTQPQRQQDYNVPQHRYTGTVSRHSDDYSEPKTVSYQPTYSQRERYQGPPVIPVVLPNGYIAETADVEAAKEHHFQLVAKAQAAVARAQERAKTSNYGYTAPTYSRQEDDSEQYEEQPQYNQVYQQPKQALYTKPSRQPYQGPPAVPVVLPSGHIADTAEVAAAKISHLQQLLDAAQRGQPQYRYHAAR